MTLSSVNEGFVLLRNLWEYNSILKYRYKKRKAYKVAIMKHLPAPLTKGYKPNLAVRVLKATFSHFKDGLQGVGSLVSGESNEDGWTRQERSKEDVDFKLWERTLGVTITYDYNSLGNFYNCVELKSLDNMFIENCHHVSASQVEDVIQSMYVKLAKNMDSYTPPKQAVNEKRKLTHVRSLKGGCKYFTIGKVYKVTEVRVCRDDSWYVKFKTNIEGEEHCRFFRDSEGVNLYADKFKLIYDNEVPVQITRSFKPYSELASMDKGYSEDFYIC